MARDLGDQLRRGVLPEDGLGRAAAGQEPQEQEQDHRQAEEDRDCHEQAPDDEPRHAVRRSLR